MDEDKQKTIAIIADEAHRSHGRKSTRTMHGTATSGQLPVIMPDAFSLASFMIIFRSKRSQSS